MGKGFFPETLNRIEASLEKLGETPHCLSYKNDEFCNIYLVYVDFDILNMKPNVT